MKLLPCRAPGWKTVAGRMSDHLDVLFANAGGGDMMPLGRLGEPQEIGKAVAFLASDSASFINGIELFVDGGMVQV